MYLIFDTETTGLPKNFKAPITDTDNWPIDSFKTATAFPVILVSTKITGASIVFVTTVVG